MRTYTGGNWIRLNVPSNWREFSSQDSVTFAPEGAYGDQGITHGAMIGIGTTQSSNLSQATQQYVQGLLQANPYLRQQSGYQSVRVAGRQGYATVLSGRSNVTGRTETVNIYTTQLRNGGLLYIAMVAPQQDSYRYNTAFRNMINSLQLND